MGGRWLLSEFLNVRKVVTNEICLQSLQAVICRQVVFALFVPSCCDKFGTSCYQLVTSMVVLSDLLQGCSINKSDTIIM